ncbi:hypothetical protein BGZ94_009806 [Podila epigama]|nr:hypothetical protein BGZ94_009806 [Podila epigama]
MDQQPVPSCADVNVGVVTDSDSTHDAFNKHPWTTQRALAAAQTEISPPISPKQRATHQAGFSTQPTQSHTHTTNTNTDTDTDTDADVDANADAEVESHDYRPSLPSSSTSSFTASSNSSTTSLSSLNSDKNNKKSTLTKLDTEPKSNLHLLDTPPSSHVPSPSSPSHPAFGFPGTDCLPITDENNNSDNDNTINNNNTNATSTTLPQPQSLSSTSSSSSLIPITPLTKNVVPPRVNKISQPKSTVQIIREVSNLVDGRDKTIKVIQYFAKVFLWLFLSDPKKHTVLANRIKALAKQFSTTRKVLRLGHFIEPMATVLTLGMTLMHSVQTKGWRRTLLPKNSGSNGANPSSMTVVRQRLDDLNSVIGLVQDISDDIYCLGVIGVLDRSFADKAEPWSNRLWMVGVSIDLHENLQSIRDVKKQIKALQENPDDVQKAAQVAKLESKLHWLQVTTVKLGGDFLFCAYDNLHCSFSDGFQAVSGFISGLAGAYKFLGKLAEA